MGLPPSDSGGDQVMVILVLSTAVTSGLEGAPGTSGYQDKQGRVLEASRMA